MILCLENLRSQATKWVSGLAMNLNEEKRKRMMMIHVMMGDMIAMDLFGNWMMGMKKMMNWDRTRKKMMLVKLRRKMRPVLVCRHGWS